jgi:indole-3-glycerol phosphate synthase
LLELHDESQLHKINDHIDLVGVNNRNLKDFSVNLDTALRLAPLLPERVVKVAESGLSDPAVGANAAPCRLPGVPHRRAFYEIYRPGGGLRSIY